MEKLTEKQQAISDFIQSKHLELMLKPNGYVLLLDAFEEYSQGQTQNISGMDSSPTVYLMDIDDEATVVVAENIAEAMDKAESVAKEGYVMVYHKSVPILH